MNFLQILSNIHLEKCLKFKLQIKNSAWEGGIRGAAAVWSPLIKKPKRVSHDLMYITDWLPTILSAAGMSSNFPNPIDGLDMWPTISWGHESPRQELVVNIDYIQNLTAIRQGDLKFVSGTTFSGEGWYGDSGNRKIEILAIEQGLDEILNSPTNRAISDQIFKVQQNRIDADEILTTLTTDEILRLRGLANLKCGVPTDKMVKN